MYIYNSVNPQLSLVKFRGKESYIQPVFSPILPIQSKEALKRRRKLNISSSCKKKWQNTASEQVALKGTRCTKCKMGDIHHTGR